MKSLVTIVAVPAVVGAILLGGCERRTPETTIDPSTQTAPGTTQDMPPGATPGTPPGTTDPAMTGEGATISPGTTGPDTSGIMGGTGTGDLGALDRDFLEATARNNMAELELSRAAAERANNPAVRTYAETLLRDHINLGQELRTLAARKGVHLPTQAAAMDTAEIERIRNARGAEFDRMYVNHLGVDAHKETIELFERAANQASDPDIQAFASEKLPTLRSHLAMAERLPAQTKG